MRWWEDHVRRWPWETFSDAVRRGRVEGILSEAASVIASAAFTAAERRLRRDDMMDSGWQEGGQVVGSDSRSG